MDLKKYSMYTSASPEVCRFLICWSLGGKRMQKFCSTEMYNLALQGINGQHQVTREEQILGATYLVLTILYGFDSAQIIRWDRELGG